MESGLVYYSSSSTSGTGIFVRIGGDTMTGTLTLNPAAQTQPNDAATIGQLTAFVAGAAWKSPGADVGTTANITLSGEQTIDGILTSASRVLVKNQSTPSENGIYVSAAGAWTRSTDADASGELNAAAITVIAGTVNAGTSWVQTTANPTIGVSPIIWAPFGNTLLDDGVTTLISGNIISVRNGGINSAQLNPAINITTTGDIVADDFTGDAASFANLQITGTGTNGWINLHGQTSPPASAIAAGDIRFYANTSGFGGVGFKTFGGQSLQFNIDQVNTGNAQIIIQDQTSIIMANVPAPVGGGNFVITDGVTLSAQATVPFANVTGTVPVANGGTGVTSFIPGSVIFMGATTFEEDNDNFFWDNTNNYLGIGTLASPTSRLTLGTFPNIATYGTIDPNALTIQISDGFGRYEGLFIEKTISSTEGAGIGLGVRTGVATGAGFGLGRISFHGEAVAGGATGVGAYIQGASQSGWTVASTSGSLQFWTTPIGSTIPSRRMTIFSQGGVSINSTSNLATTYIIPLSTTNVGVMVRGNASQTGDLYEGTDSTGALMFRVAPNGSTQGVDLRAFGTAGNGFVQLAQQSSDPSAVTNASRIYSNSTGLFTVRTGIGVNATYSFTNTNLTANRIYTLQDSSHILANVPSVVGAGIVKTNGTTLSSSDIDLTTDVGASILPMANGGTGVSTIGSGVVTSNGTTLSSYSRTTLIATATQTLTSTTPTAIVELTTGTLAPGSYRFSGVIVFQSTAGGTGIGFRMNPGTATMTTCYGKFRVSQAANGTSKDYIYDQLTTATNVTSASVSSANTDALATFDGIFTVTVSGTVAMQFRSETGTSVSIRAGSFMVVEAI